MTAALRDIVARNRAGEAAAIPSVCSAHPEVLRAALLLAEERGRPIVIEATSNQVNQDGGYTGMTPADFVAFVYDIADRSGVARGRITLGGDHLGPQAWRNGPAEAAMAKARDMVAAYVAAGFTKIHLDCSEGCAGEPAQLPDAVTAARSAQLAAICETHAPDPEALCYVIGTEVPPPGGARIDDHGAIPATTPESARATLAAHRAAFEAAGLGHILGRIAGLVVQPGVEFTPMTVHHLPMTRDPALRRAIADWPALCLEAHSTDYQKAQAYPRLAELGFAFQKVGPALTFAYRRAIYALGGLADIIGQAPESSVMATMEGLMLADPSSWQGHYRGPDSALCLQRHFGLADRIRYYWPRKEAQIAVGRLLAALSGQSLPDPLLWQVFAPETVERAKMIAAKSGFPIAEALVHAEIQLALAPYYFETAARAEERTVS